MDETRSTLIGGAVATKEEAIAESALRVRVDAIAEGIKAGIKAGQEKELQQELARLFRILRHLYDEPNISAVARAGIAAKALIQEAPSLVLAEEVLDSLESNFRKNPLAMTVRGRSAPARVIFGLGTLLYFALPLGNWMFSRISDVKQVLGKNVSMLVGVSLAGALGSVVSIMVRLQDFASVNVKDPTVFFHWILQAHCRDVLRYVRICVPQRGNSSISGESRHSSSRVFFSDGGVLIRLWPKLSTTRHSDTAETNFEVIHPHHPLRGQKFKLITYRHNWGEDRVYFHDATGRLRSIPAGWTTAKAEHWPQPRTLCLNRRSPETVRMD